MIHAPESCQRLQRTNQEKNDVEAIWSSGMDVLVTVTGTLNAEGYMQLLFNKLLPIWNRDLMLHQDNATPHKPASTMDFLPNNGMMIVNNWPALPPDLNMIEDMWKMVGDRVEGQSFENKIFYGNVSIFPHLFDSIPKRTKAVIKNKGYCIRY